MVTTKTTVTKRISLDEVLKAFGIIGGDVVAFDVPKKCRDKHLLIIVEKTEVIE